MYDKRFIANAIERSAETSVDRRKLLTLTGLAGAGAAAAAFLPAASASADTGGVSDATVLNFALNLEYLEAEFYLRAAYGEGLSSSMTDGKGSARRGVRRPQGAVQVEDRAELRARDREGREAARRVPPRGPRQREGRAPVDLPRRGIHRGGGRRRRHQEGPEVRRLRERHELPARRVHLRGRRRHGVQGRCSADHEQDLSRGRRRHPRGRGVPRRPNPWGALRRRASRHRAIFDTVQKISDVRDAVDGPTDDDQGIGNRSYSNIVPTDGNSIAFGRTPGQVLNIVYLNNEAVSRGGFFPQGVNGAIRTSSDSDGAAGAARASA